MDAFNHAVAPKTSALMTEGPYRLCRNPMLLGVCLYYLELLMVLCSLGATIIFLVFIGIMMVQVSCISGNCWRRWYEGKRMRGLLRKYPGKHVRIDAQIHIYQ